MATLFSVKTTHAHHITQALERGLWQTNSTRGRVVAGRKGDIVAISTVGSQDLTILGIATTDMQLEPVQDWALPWIEEQRQEAYTIHFRPLNLNDIAEYTVPVYRGGRMSLEIDDGHQAMLDRIK